MALARVGYLGPEGSFSHEAVLTLPGTEPVACASIADVLAGVADGSLDTGLVPLENAIEGTVSATIDGLVFDHDLVIEREVILPIHLHLLARPGVALGDVTRVSSYVHALAQVRGFLAGLSSVNVDQATSTSQAARDVAASSEPCAAVGSAVAGSLFGLVIIASDIADHPGNATRFVEVGRGDIPAVTGNDRTSIVCFQDADRPGSLYAILGRFAARDINLTKLESRPTKLGLGSYCFVIEFDGHVGDEIVADCLADLQAHLVRVKFLGSYPVTGEGSTNRREEVGEARRFAAQWISAIRGQIRN
ncbi:MAG: prephenate dehydratase [Acidimicrobiaceae bacterium]|nr:prephenate dehydratase [Acidimicrobiaceae bacterium]